MGMRWNEIDALASQAEGNGGYLRRGSDDIQVGDTILRGKDALELVIRLNQRMVARVAGDRNKESYQQGREDALREVRAALEALR